MSSRRNFIKAILSVGAIILPWTAWPTKIKVSLNSLAERPKVNLVVPPKELPKKELKEEALSRKAMDDILALTNPELKGRRAGTTEEANAAKYLSKQLSMLGLKPLGEKEAGFTQVFTIPPVIEKVLNGRLTFSLGDPADLRTPCVNVIGGLMGEQTEEAIMISAHYDHIGTYKGELYPGANDNASGVGCVLDVIRRVVREGKKTERSIIVAFWSAEEMGFVGSRAFIQNPSIPIDKIKAVINVDTIGNGMIGNFATWSEDDNLAVKAVQRAAKASGASALPAEYLGHNSDHISFARAGIPAVTLMARDWLTLNHTPQDTYSLVKAEQVKIATEIVYKAVLELARAAES